MRRELKSFFLYMISSQTIIVFWLSRLAVLILFDGKFRPESWWVEVELPEISFQRAKVCFLCIGRKQHMPSFIIGSR